jgi:peptide/nickel transport system substrate-binding protein
MPSRDKVPSEEILSAGPDRPDTTSAPRDIDPDLLENRSFREAPMLADRVSEGKLPPVSERLPENPRVIVPVEKTGTYGGTLYRNLTSDINEESTIRKTLNDSLMEYPRDGPGNPRVNFAESYEFTDQGRSVVFKLRKGTYWSDGAPFTVDDILFWYEDMTLDDEARNAPLFPSRWTSGGNPVGMEKVDDYTLKIYSDRKLGMILRTLCFDHFASPKHVLAPFHPRYDPAASYRDFRTRTTAGQMAFSPEIPRLSAFVPVEWTKSRKVVFERNPYYWKIDTEGNQLPYIDRIEFSIVRNPDLALLKFTNGETDIFDKSLNDVSIYNMLNDIEKDGVGITIRKTEKSLSPVLYLNWDAPDPNVRTAFRERKVRMALSHAINRLEIGGLLNFGLLEPVGFSFSPSSIWYSKETAALHSDYDPVQARSLLDQADYLDRDHDGYREFHDGSVFEIVIDVFEGRSMADLCQLIKEYWEAIGVKTVLNFGLQEILIPRRINGTFQVHITDPPIDPLIQGNHMGAVGPHLSFWHRNAGTGNTAWMHEVTRLIRKAENSLDDDVIDDCMNQVCEIFTRELPYIGIGRAPLIWASSDRVGNIPNSIFAEMQFRGLDRGIFHAQIYIRSDPERLSE